ncbi:phosphoadenosine phosphosulfate reductase domain-containing protein [Clostridium novyi]|uniref:phosphoadenosine phosphosulfate reductase domain-containing protein n=1 Tax=Clostridium novyi TaxID=1542 RepID=UPI00057EF21E|nr:phosphoadenosine phosphosulfate reductase family protein [Clostridium novyi]
MKRIAFASGGKDSTAMIDIMLDCCIKVDEIVFIANEKEFPQEKEFRNFLINRWNHKAKCTVIQRKIKWDDWFYGRITRGSRKGLKRGFPTTLYPCWWTREAKVNAIEKYIKYQKVKYNEDVIQYIGYTKDEKSNTRQDMKWNYYSNKVKQKRFPLIDWGMSESDCYKYCYEEGILNPLYNYFKRLGCYLCPKQSEESLRTLKKYFPEQWNELIKYLEDTCKSEFVDPGQFNIKFNLEDLYYL